mmetsp:Transcript_9408/g.23165  ORF Transcript_9408/g.23165 Transcript_9408/m.23165 type:complete len:112 (-) Transcript_9408:1821-2156(-)
MPLPMIKYTLRYEQEMVRQVTTFLFRTRLLHILKDYDVQPLWKTDIPPYCHVLDDKCSAASDGYTRCSFWWQCSLWYHKIDGELAAILGIAIDLSWLLSGRKPILSFGTSK